MSKARAIKQLDGSISVIYPARKSKNDNETEDQWLERVFEQSTPVGLKYLDINIDNVPLDRTFRNAWSLISKKITVDMPKAKTIHMDNIRKVRNTKLKEKDLDFLLAVEKKDIKNQDQIAIEKQILRDIPQNFDLSIAKTPDELKKLWPDELN